MASPVICYPLLQGMFGSQPHILWRAELEASSCGGEANTPCTHLAKGGRHTLGKRKNIVGSLDL
jgi:hypothetical protein